MLSRNGVTQSNTFECSKIPDAVYADVVLDLNL